MIDSAGIRSLAVAFPKQVRTNDYFTDRYPEAVAKAQSGTLARVFSPDNADPATLDAFSLEMLPYMDDPFKGTIERRILADGETALSLELTAARRALAAAGMTPGDVDLIMVSSFTADQLGVGNATFLTRQLGVARPCFNLEAACASSVVGFHTACGLVQAGHYRNILVVASSTCSRITDERDTLSWFLGDGAGAFVVGRVAEGEGLLGMHTVPTTETCDTFSIALDLDAAASKHMVVRVAQGSGKILHETAEPYLRQCCEEAAKRAGVKVRDIDFFIFNTPTAWYARFGARVLGVDPERTISVFPRNGNMGAAMMPANLHLAAETSKIKRGDLVLVYGVGSVASASAAVMRWGDVSLGEAPELSR